MPPRSKHPDFQTSFTSCLIFLIYRWFLGLPCFRWQLALVLDVYTEAVNWQPAILTFIQRDSHTHQWTTLLSFLPSTLFSSLLSNFLSPSSSFSLPLLIEKLCARIHSRSTSVQYIRRKKGKKEGRRSLCPPRHREPVKQPCLDNFGFLPFKLHLD